MSTVKEAGFFNVVEVYEIVTGFVEEFYEVEDCSGKITTGKDMSDVIRDK